jgi:putative FmdB family regulatory protein
MPIYEYVCDDCGAQYEALRPMKDADSPISCKNCESRKTKRAISAFFAQSNGRVIAGDSGGCGSCAGGSCSGCGHSHN